MQKSTLVEILKNVNSGQFIKIECDLGIIEGKLFKFEGRTVLLYAEQQPSIDLTFEDKPDTFEISWIDSVKTGISYTGQQ
jgi:hypothetical protein